MTSEDSIRTADHEAVLASLLEAVVAFGPGGQVNFVNPAAESLLSRSGRTLIGRDLSNVFRSTPWIAEMLRRLGPEHPVVREQGELVLSNGNVPVLAEASLVPEREAIETAGTLVLYDLTRRGELQNQENQRRRVAELDRMAAQFAHEINNPLSGIRGAAQLLGRKLAERHDLVEYTELIVRQVDRLSELVEALMALEAPVLRKQPVNVHRIMDELMLLERSSADQRGIVFEAEFDPSLPEVSGDPARLEQLFLNILRNAVAHCPPSLGRIRVATRMDNSFYVDRNSERVSFLSVSIADNGPGLDEEALENCFSPLFSRRPGGHGMGLAIAGAIAMAHDGRIRAANVPGGGAIFHVSLPLARTREPIKGEHP
ncbi:MAG TPA: ATP-binding protein [Candidatus Limnocylindrales bacterium]|nr:ATP-binding protein [Candidatus Limnocylindrales bacterium]